MVERYLPALTQSAVKQLHSVAPLHHLNDDSKRKHQRYVGTPHRHVSHQRSVSPVASIHTTALINNETATATATTSASSTSSPVTVPYNIHRTSSQQLPVYTDHKAGARVITILRRFSGDQSALLTEIRLLLGPNVSVEQRQGKIVIQGQYTQPIKQWLEQLGF